MFSCTSCQHPQYTQDARCECVYLPKSSPCIRVLKDIPQFVWQATATSSELTTQMTAHVSTESCKRGELYTSVGYPIEHTTMIMIHFYATAATTDTGACCFPESYTSSWTETLASFRTASSSLTLSAQTLVTSYVYIHP